MNYNKLSIEEIEGYERQLLDKADNFWIELYGKKESSDLEKLRCLSRQGKIQDKFHHDIMIGYFKKQGLASDGRTTLQEREKQLTLKKTEFGVRIKKIKDSSIQNIDEIIKRAEVKKKELNQIPKQLKEKYKVDRNAILQELRDDLNAFFERAENDIEKEVVEVYEDFIKSVKARQDAYLEKALQEIENLQKNCKNKMISDVEHYGAELEAELQVLENVESENKLIKQYEAEIKKINQEIMEIKDLPITYEDIQNAEVEPKKIEEVFLCPYCDHEPFGNKGGLYGHIKVKHGEEKYNEYKQQDEGVKE